MNAYTKSLRFGLFLYAMLILSLSCKRQSFIPRDDNANLALLAFSEGKLQETFSSEKTEYNLKVPAEAKNIFVLAVTENPKSKHDLVINGTVIPINVIPCNGIPIIQFEIVVTAPAGNKKTYKITAKKEGSFPLPDIPPIPGI